MNIILFDDVQIRQSLLPLTFTRPIAELRVGILTISEKWRHHTGGKISYETDNYLNIKFPKVLEGENLWINAACCPDQSLLNAIEALENETVLVFGKTIIAAKSSRTKQSDELSTATRVTYTGVPVLIDKLWKIFKLNAQQVKSDFKLITKNRTSADIEDPHTRVYGRDNIFIEEGVSIKASIINAENGPIYIGKGAQIHEGSIIRGSFALCEGAQLNMGTKIRGDSTIGPYCKVGGEVSNSVILGYSNKSHDGFIGNSVIGEWCNLGAGTNTSNLKNNYENVKIWDFLSDQFIDTGETFCGLIMGDHSKCSINTMFNTGTVVGVFSNVFGSGFPRSFVPSFAWGGATEYTTYQMKKVLEVAVKVLERREMVFDDIEKSILYKVFELTAKNRIWEMKNQKHAI